MLYYGFPRFTVSVFESGAAVKTSREVNGNVTRRVSTYCETKQDVRKIKEDKTMKDKDVSQINMYDLFLGLVSKESGIEFHTKQHLII